MRKIECEMIDIMLPGNQVIGETFVMVTILMILVDRKTKDFFRTTEHS